MPSPEVTVAVTGAAGRVGRWVVARLHEKNIRPVLIDGRAAPGEMPSEGWVQDRLMDPVTLTPHLRGCSAVIHLAGTVPSHGRSARDFWEGNVCTTAVVAEAAATAGVGVVVLASSSHVYGASRGAPLSEDDVTHPASAYAATKVAAENVGRAWALSGGSGFIAARLGTLYGFRNAEETVIGRLVEQALRGGPLAVRSLTDIRDFTHVADAAEALVRLSLLGLRQESVAVNVSTGVGVSVASAVAAVRQAAGSHDMPVSVEFPDTVGSTLVMNVDRLRALTGYAPHQDIHDGILTMVREGSMRGSRA